MLGDMIFDFDDVLSWDGDEVVFVKDGVFLLGWNVVGRGSDEVGCFVDDGIVVVL